MEARAIQTISRALQLLAALNRRHLSTVEELHHDTGLPKSTVVRLLQALIADGYAEQVSRSAGYRLRARVLNLTSGFRQGDLLVDVARPLMDGFTHEHKWPLYLGTLQDTIVRVRYTTAAHSSVAPDYEPGYRYPLSPLVSALGKAYLAFCSQAERRHVLNKLVGSVDVQDGLTRDAATVNAMIAQVKKRGYATTGSIRGDRGRGLAVPVREGRRTIAAITVRHFRSSLSEEAAARRFLEPLRALAANIGERLKQAKNNGVS